MDASEKQLVRLEAKLDGFELACVQIIETIGLERVEDMMEVSRQRIEDQPSQNDVGREAMFATYGMVSAALRAIRRRNT